MICRYCDQDVNNPCHDQSELKERALNHIPRCEEAMRAERGEGGQPSDRRVDGRS
jgi:hypothetical protein